MEKSENKDFTDEYEASLSEIKRSAEKSQAERFRKAARKAEADTSDNALDRVFGKLDLKRKPEADEQKDQEHD